MYSKNKNKSIHLFKNSSIKNEKKRASLLREKIRPVNITEVTTLKDLVDSWGQCGLQSRKLAECAKVYESMLLDKDRPTVMLGISGALIAGGLRKVLSDMISEGLVDVVVSTGAILYQDYYAAKGYAHSRGSPYADDSKLHALYINRIYDTYVDEIGFVECDEYIANFCNTLEPKRYSTREFFYKLGSTLNDEHSVLYNAYRYDVPVYCPAIADSSVGIGAVLHYRSAKANKVSPVMIDTIKDNYEIGQIVLTSKKTGAIYVGGGVPKNYINDAAIMFDYTKGHTYAFQITTASPQWGGLSGSTLDEAKSWGKVSTKAHRSTVYGEATIILPLIVGYILQKGIHDGRPRLKFLWNDDTLRGIKKIRKKDSSKERKN